MRIKQNEHCYIEYGKDDINEQHRKLNGELREENKQLKSIIKTIIKEYNLEPSEYVENLLKGE